MHYELRYQVIEPKRQTYTNVSDRLGDQPTSRYLEATLDVQPTENFHYRPTWMPDRELYDARYSAFRLSDAYRFLDPRQFYYTPYVTNRAALHEEFGRTLSYLEERDLLARLPNSWRSMMAEVVLPLRHYESGAQMVSVTGARFAYGTSIEQCCTFAAFDRIGNAQMLSRLGLALSGGSAEVLTSAKSAWMGAGHVQPLRRTVEEIMVEGDWAAALMALDLLDSLLYPLLYRGLDAAALLGGAGAYSLFAQHLTAWFADQRKWVDALVQAWITDPAHGAANRQQLAEVAHRWSDRAQEAVAALVTQVDNRLPDAGAATILSLIVDDQKATLAEWGSAA